MTRFLSKTLLAAAATVSALVPAHAQLNWGPTQTYMSMISTLGNGPINVPSSWLSTPATGGIVSAGLFQIPVGPGQVAGNLLQIIVDRPFTIGPLPANVTVSIDVDGYAAPPTLGLAGNSGGMARTMVTHQTVSNLQFPNSHPVVANTTVQIPLSLVAGAATWPTSNPPVQLTATLGTGNYYLRQVFDLDGVYLSGPGGTWDVDLPLVSMLTPVPEPAAWALMALGLTGLGVARKRHLPGRCA